MSAPALVVVMPAYNEQASVRKVVVEWFQEVENWTEDFIFLAIDDGSKDGTLSVLKRLAEKLGPRLVIRSRENRGHGQTCLEGYRVAREMGAEYVFQIDSDGQCDPQYFFRFWREREKFEAIYGVRTRRDDGFQRLVVSMVLRVFTFVCFGVFCPDANVPYRLYRIARIEKTVASIPSGVYLANAVLAILLAKDRACRHGYIPIRFRERYGGEPSVKAAVFATKALELYRDLRSILNNKQG
jgi:dolichol-phosphate mannosyltransferase